MLGPGGDRPGNLLINELQFAARGRDDLGDTVAVRKGVGEAMRRQLVAGRVPGSLDGDFLEQQRARIIARGYGRPRRTAFGAVVAEGVSGDLMVIAVRDGQGVEAVRTRKAVVHPVVAVVGDQVMAVGQGLAGRRVEVVVIGDHHTTARGNLDVGPGAGLGRDLAYDLAICAGEEDRVEVGRVERLDYGQVGAALTNRYPAGETAGRGRRR